MKQRKPRKKSVPLDFDGAHQFGQPIPFPSTIAVDKLIKRLNEEKCIGCGKEKCECKSHE